MTCSDLGCPLFRKQRIRFSDAPAQVGRNIIQLRLESLQNDSPGPHKKMINPQEIFWVVFWVGGSESSQAKGRRDALPEVVVLTWMKSERKQEGTLLGGRTNERPKSFRRFIGVWGIRIAAASRTSSTTNKPSRRSLSSRLTPAQHSTTRSTRSGYAAAIWYPTNPP